MKLTLLFFAFCFSISSGFAQQSISGTLQDTANKKHLANAVVSVLGNKDSVLITFTRSDASGNFFIKQVPKGDYIVMVTHPQFGEYVDRITIKEGAAADLGKIYLTDKAVLMKEIIIKQQIAAIRQKGDTTEYIADSFKVHANATVEDLLKIMPGIQVDKDGKITSQGKTVEKVLVDGEEFFGDDPTIATKNLRADAIDKVQSFDKKSEQAEFTGIDDGQTTRTLNLKIKENRKNGYFGKLVAGIGPKGFFNNEGMINAFKGKRKIAAFGIMSNTGRTGLGWEDKSNYGGGNNFEFDEASGNMFSYSSWDNEGFDNEQFYGDGVPKSWTGGVHFSNKWLEDKRHLNLNYRYGKINTEAVGSTIEQTILPDTIYFQNNRGNKISSKYRNKIDGSYEVKLDSFSSIKITADASVSRNTSVSINDRDYLDIKGNMINSSLSTFLNTADTRTFNANIIYKKRFRKKGRTISVNLSEKMNETESNGIIGSNTDYFNAAGGLDSTLDIDQKKTRITNSNVFSTKISYTEPLHKNGFLEANYALTFNNSENKRSTFIKSANDKYDDVVDSLSNDYLFDITTNSGGLNYRYADKKYNVSIGTNVAQTTFKQNDLETLQKRNINYTNLFPRASFSYAFSQFKRISANYNGSTKQPSLDQIQPLRENSDPLNQQIGNPDLGQSFTHNASINFNDYKVLNNTYVWASIQYTTTDNAISNAQSYSRNGTRISRYINVNGNRSIRSYINYGTKIKKINTNIGFNGSIGLNKNVNVINDIKNVNDNNDYRFGISLNYIKEKKFDIGVNSNATYTTSKSSVNPDYVTNLWQQEYSLNTRIQLPWKFEVTSDVNFMLRQKTTAFDNNNNVIKWNASLGKKLFKGDVGMLNISAFDILDQNLGYSRYVSSNYVSEKVYNTIRRYFMLSLTYNFSKNGAKPASGF